MNSNIACAISIFKHKYYVWVAGRKLGVPIWQLITHDLSKFSPEEFPYYRKAFFEGDRKALAPGWLHHMNSNRHHYNYWLLRGGRHKIDESGITAIDMPRKYVLEMVADWMGAQMTYQHNWDSREWIKKHLPEMQLSDNTMIVLFNILDSIDGGVFL